MKNGYFIDTLTSVDIQEIVKIGGEVIQIYEVVKCRENFKVSPFRKVSEMLFALRQRYKNEGNALMPALVKLVMNALYGIQIRKYFIDFYKCRSQQYMETEYDDEV